MIRKLIILLVLGVLALVARISHADDLWITHGTDGQPEVQLYFFWSLSCPHCTAARPFIEAIPKARPWVKLQALELTRHPENVRLYQTLARQLGEQAASVPALLFCGEMQVGWADDATTGALIRQRLDDCYARALGVQSDDPPATVRAPPTELIDLPLLGRVEPTTSRCRRSL